MKKRHLFSKRLLTAVLASAMLLQAAVMPAMAQESTVWQQNQTDSEGLIPGSPWYDTNILGNLPDRVPAETEDFNAAVNYEWLAAQTEIPSGYSKYGIREKMWEDNRNNLIAILEKENPTRRNEKMASAIYRAALDMDARNEAGMSPILPYINRIREISTIDELTAYLTDGEFHLESPFIYTTIGYLPKDTTKYMKVMTVDFGIGTGDDSFYADRMNQAGIPKAEADTYIQQGMELLDIINEASSSYSPVTESYAAMMESIYCPVTLEELRQNFSSFPFADIMESQGYGEGVVLSLPIVDDFKALDHCYTEENLEGLKGILIEKIFDTMAGFLDEENLPYYEAVNGALSDNPKFRALTLTESLIAEPLGQIYASYYVTEEMKQDVTQMVQDIKLAFIDRVAASEWMTEETRAKAMDKIRAIGVRAAVPDKWRDYSGLRLPSAEEGAVFADYAIAILEHNSKLEYQEVTSPVDHDYWPTTSRTIYSVWAAYTPSENTINIPAGILSDVFYKPDGTLEERYFSLGTVLGHELTHSLDPDGSLLDKTGASNDWWTPEDRAAYEERQNQVEEYFGNIMVKPGEYVDSQFTIGESVADLGGVSLLLDVLRKKDNIDYQKAFRAYAQLWPEVETSETATALLNSDAHPPKYVRVNAVVQQFQEFYDAFGVEEGDSMYLAPEDRVGIWR